MDKQLAPATVGVYMELCSSCQEKVDIGDEINMSCGALVHRSAYKQCYHQHLIECRICNPNSGNDTMRSIF